jgi:adenine-specific DNA-methyltransferase
MFKLASHVTLGDIANNTALDAITAKHRITLDACLEVLNRALAELVSEECRALLLAKLSHKESERGAASITEADRRRYVLPTSGWDEWGVPFDADTDWPVGLIEPLTAYREAYTARTVEVDACILANADTEVLVDQPEVVKGVVRVSGPFTVESVIPIEQSLGEESLIGGAPEELDTFDDADTSRVNAETHVDKVVRLLRADGVRFPSNTTLQFSRLARADSDFLHAEGEWEAEDGEERRIAVSVGPEHGSVTAYQVENALHAANKLGFDDLLFLGFGFDGAAQAAIDDDANPRVRCHMAEIDRSVNRSMDGLLKETRNSQLFTVFGTPRTELRPEDDGQYVIEMHGVDIYNPVDNTIQPTNADKVAAWFLDSDYDGRTFCITQAFLPDKNAWTKLQKALKGVIDEERFDALSGTESLPFPVGEYRRAAVKVIDPRGNEVMRIHRLGGNVSYETP